jgi:2-iminobutanoate/2-iminopropanoate deaminase
MDIHKKVYTDRAPAAVGPYSQAVIHGKLVYTSGQLPISPVSGEIEERSIAGQTKQALDNLSSVLIAGGSDLSYVIKTTVYIKDMGTFSEMNRIYGSFFNGLCPARSCIEAAGLPKDALIEIEAIAYIP